MYRDNYFLYTYTYILSLNLDKITYLKINLYNFYYFSLNSKYHIYLFIFYVVGTIMMLSIKSLIIQKLLVNISI